MFKALQHLLPIGRAFYSTIDKQLRQFLEGLGNALDAPRQNFDDIYDDTNPETTSQITEWETEFGLQDNLSTDAERRVRLAARWQAQGGQSPRYCQDTLRGAEFDVYVHEWWQQPVVGDPEPRDPTLILPVSEFITDACCGNQIAVCGNERMICGGTFTPGTDIINGGDKTIGTDENTWRYFVYVGAEVFPNNADVPSDRKQEFRNLCNALFPAQLWVGLLVNYIETPVIVLMGWNAVDNQNWNIQPDLSTITHTDDETVAGIRSVSSHSSSGKWQMRYTINDTLIPDEAFLGIADSAQPLNLFPDDAVVGDSAGLQLDGTSPRLTGYFNSGGATDFSELVDFVLGDVIDVLVNLDDNEISILVNGVSEGTVHSLPPGVTFFAFCYARDLTEFVGDFTGATFTPEAGYSAWDA